MTVAETILQQLGGRFFVTTTGARNFVGTPDSLTMRLPYGAGSKVPSGVRITLTQSDTYRMETYRIRKAKVTRLAVREDVYCDQLQDAFESMTGLIVCMGRRVQFG